MKVTEDWGKHRIPFGQWKGKTLEQISRLDPTYLDWILDELDEDSITWKSARGFRNQKNKAIIGDKKIGKIFG